MAETPVSGAWALSLFFRCHEDSVLKVARYNNTGWQLAEVLSHFCCEKMFSMPHLSSSSCKFDHFFSPVSKRRLFAFQSFISEFYLYISHFICATKAMSVELPCFKLWWLLWQVKNCVKFTLVIKVYVKGIRALVSWFYLFFFEPKDPFTERRYLLNQIFLGKFSPLRWVILVVSAAKVASIQW